jgi:hypothetical protein
MVVSQGKAITERSLASTMPSPSKLEAEIGVPLTESQNLMSPDVKEASWELFLENMTEETKPAPGWREVVIKGSHCAGPPPGQNDLYVISLQCLLYGGRCVGVKGSAG